MLLDPETLARLSRFSIRMRRPVAGGAAGHHASRARGSSAVFAEHREYRPGDELRRLDWKAYARTDRYVVKEHEHESDLRVWLALDDSGSMHYGEGQTHKQRYAAALLYGVASIVLHQGDAVGAVRFSSGVDAWLAPGRHTEQLHRLENLFLSDAGPRATSLPLAWSQLLPRTGRRGLIVIASDFLDFKEDALEEVRAFAAQGHQLVVFHIVHPAEIAIPFEDAALVSGFEGEESVEVEPAELAKAYKQAFLAHVAKVHYVCTQAGAYSRMVRTDTSVEEALGRWISHSLSPASTLQSETWG